MFKNCLKVLLIIQLLTFNLWTIKPNSLNFPVPFLSKNQQIMNDYHQWNRFYGTDYYFHGGLDLQTHENASVIAPSDGRIFCGYYNIKHFSSGHYKVVRNEKMYGGNVEKYFEIILVTKENFIIEMHHVNPKSISNQCKKWNTGDGLNVKKGQVIGKVVNWDYKTLDNTYYHHIHLNVISPTGERLNPRYFFKKITDVEAPTIENVWTNLASNRYQVLHSREVSLITDEILVQAVDKVGAGVNPPVRWKIYQNGKLVFSRDFSKRKKYFKIKNVFATRFYTNDGKFINEYSVRNQKTFYLRIPIKINKACELLIEVEDYAKNKSTLKLFILGRQAQIKYGIIY